MTAQIFGILNVTPDSFSDGGQYSDVEGAVARGIHLSQQGADLVDVGGESTRPGAERVSAAEGQERVIPVIRGLVAAEVRVSIDTMNAETALAAAEVGASVINDVSGGLADPEMYRAVAATGLTYVAMHWRGAPSAEHPEVSHTQASVDLARYDDVVSEVRGELKARLAEMLVWGIAPDKIVLDPGLGFAKNAVHNWQLLARLDELANLGYPLLIGASRKRFLAELAPGDAADRDLPSAVISALAAQAGAWAVRVHDVPSTRAALAVTSAWKDGAA